MNAAQMLRDRAKTYWRDSSVLDSMDMKDLAITCTIIADELRDIAKELDQAEATPCQPTPADEPCHTKTPPNEAPTPQVTSSTQTDLFGAGYANQDAAPLSATTGGTGSVTQHTTTLTEHTQHRRTNE